MIGVETDVSGDWDSRIDWPALARSAVHSAVAHSRHRYLSDSEVSVKFTSDEEVRSLNAEWRGKDKPTNVLSFPMAEEADLHQATVTEQELLLGDIVLARGVCESEAADKSLPLERHTAHLIVHGTLHLLGFDHGDEAEAADMERREVRALARLGIADPYQGPA